MKNIIKITVFVTAASFAISGCATMNYPTTYKVEGKEFVQFKEMDDDRALKLVALIYNVTPETWEDGIARSIALEDYLMLLSKRKSKYIKNSGIFEAKYEKVKLSAWKDEDLIKLFETLSPKADIYYMDAAPELTEVQNAQRIVYLTAISAIDTQMKKRRNTQSAVSMVSQILMTALSVALSMI
ncbi:MAG: hypothetical protein NTZ95_07710 [Candidatus Omnitrophica bacterium]|nr:hypothetical protein [Candidatus Omnitrophota bacterium]